MKRSNIILNILIFVAFINFSQPLLSQDLYTLDKCIEIGLANNANVKNAAFLKKDSELNVGLSKMAMIPDASINVNGGIANGRSINPYTNDFINQSLNFSNLTLQVSLPLYNGLKIKNGIERSKIDLEMKQFLLEDAQQNLKKNIIVAYSNVVNLKLQKEVLVSRMAETKKQLDRFSLMLQEGAGSQSDVQNFKGQYAGDQISIASIHNQIEIAKNGLAIFMNTTLDFDVFVDNDSLDTFVYDEKEVLEKSSAVSPSIAAADKAVQFATTQLKVIKGDLFPRVSLFGQMNSNYSSAAERFIENGIEEKTTGDYVNFGSERFPVLRQQTTFRNEVIGLTNQINNNLNSAIGISISIPLTGYFSTKKKMAIQSNLIELASAQYESSKITLHNAVQIAIKNYNLNNENIALYKEQIAAFAEAYRIEEVKFTSGVTNFSSFSTAKNNMDNARLDLVNVQSQAKLWGKLVNIYTGQ